MLDAETISVNEAARMLGISRNAAYLAVASGQIPSIRIGRLILIPKPALMQMLETGIAPDPEPREPYRHFGEDDDKIIAEDYANGIAVEDTANKLGRNKSAIYRRVAQLGLRTRSTIRRFTEYEDQTLVEDYANHVPVSEIANKLNRSRGSIEQRVLHLGLRRSHIITRLLSLAPDHLKARVHELQPDAWLTECYAWRDQQQQALNEANHEQREQQRAHRMELSATIDQDSTLSRNDKIKAKRMAGLTLEEIATQYMISRERVRQIADPLYTASGESKLLPDERLRRFEERHAREREQIMIQAAQRLFALWQATPPEARAMFRAMIDGD